MRKSVPRAASLLSVSAFTLLSLCGPAKAAPQRKAQAADASQLTAVEYFHRGAERQDKGDLGGAVADFTKAIKLDPKDAEAYSAHGRARNKKGDYDAAVADTSRRAPWPHRSLITTIASRGC
jgi:tetratricopeptide (TPR) repeat protein